MVKTAAKQSFNKEAFLYAAKCVLILIVVIIDLAGHRNLVRNLLRMGNVIILFVLKWG